MTELKQNKYENFPLSLAVLDALPVIFFSVAMLLVAVRYKNIIFLAGAISCTFAGCAKVIWKIIIAATKKDIAWLNKQLRFFMPVGFLLILIGILAGIRKGVVKTAALKTAVCSMPSCLFFAGTIVCMIVMSVFAVKLDSTKVRSHWMEQIVNTIGQFFFLLGIYFAYFVV